MIRMRGGNFLIQYAEIDGPDQAAQQCNLIRVCPHTESIETVEIMNGTGPGQASRMRRLIRFFLCSLFAVKK